MKCEDDKAVMDKISSLKQKTVKSLTSCLSDGSNRIFLSH